MSDFQLDNKVPIDDSEATVQKVLGNLQGNILKGHGREHGLFLFFTFGGDLTQVKDSLCLLASKYVTSALKQHMEAEDFRAFKIPGSLFGNLLLSATGYKKLGLDPDTLFPEGPEPIASTQSSFAAGLKATAKIDFDDPPVKDWEEGFQQEIDAMLLLADDDRDYLLREGRRAITEIAAHNTVCSVQIGDALRNEDGEGIEHFGYVDGRSQPLYLKSDFQLDAAGNRIAEKDGGSINVWDPFEPLNRVLVRDPVIEDSNCHGSFMVFRKLEQDVLHFKMREQELADVLEFVGEERELGGAMAVGRFEDGTPVTLQKTDGLRPAKENNFTYAKDADAQKCPFHAHIRKANPRGDIPPTFPGTTDEDERRRRITRRGITYGSRQMHPSTFQGLDQLPSGGVGLLFMCFQASIRQQFAFMQRGWCNNPDFVRPGTGLDPVIGHPPTPPAVEQSWPTDYGNPGTVNFRFEHFVRMKGGEYFFEPTMIATVNLDQFSVSMRNRR